MSLALLQNKLNVTQKRRSNLFNWRGQFTPDFVDYLLHHFTKQGDLVVDPFSGSGTVLQEASSRNLRATGFEINPSAYAMSKFFTFSNLDLDERQKLIKSLGDKLGPTLETFNGEKVFIEHQDYRLAYSSLLNVGIKLLPNLSKAERILLLNILFLSERDKKMLVRQSVQKSFNYVADAMLKLPHSEYQIDANLCDARQVGSKLDECVDLILTSPPYINVFNYHQNYRALVEIFDFDILKVANSEFGSNRKNRGNRFRTVVQYCLDMEEAISSFWSALKPDSYLIIVLGKQSNVRNVAFYNGQLIMDILAENGGFSKTDILYREFVNKFGINIKEDILIYQKVNQKPHVNSARSVAKRHLETNLSTVDGEILNDLSDAIRNIETIEPSPMFNFKTISKNA